MKNKILIAATILLLISIFIYFKMKKTYDENISFGSETFHRILIDSLKINNEDNIYWFKYNTGVLGYVGDFISIENQSSKIDSSNALLMSDCILKIDTIKNDSIFLYVSNLNHRFFKPHSRYKFVFLQAKNYYDTQSKRKELLLNLDEKK